MPAYEKFAARTANLSPDERAGAFVREIVSRYPDYYAPVVYGDTSQLHARAVRFFDPAKRAAMLAGLPPLTEAHLAQMGSVIGPEFLRQQRRFIRTFPDFRCASTVEFAVSLMKFDGHPVEFGGKQHLLFGVDVIAALHDDTDMPAFFDHEIFHLYQRQVLPAQPPMAADPAWLTLWTEGLATYVSQRMNPQLDAQHVLWYPPDMVTRMRTQTGRAAGLFLRDIDKTNSEADRWFLGSTQVESLPARTGYYLGYLFAKSVGDGVELPALARMPLEQVHEKARAFLTALERSPPEPAP